MKPAVKKFTKERPCTKLDIHNCFASAGGYKTVGVVEAQAQIGVNVPRVLERAGRLIWARGNVAETYSLTEEGEEWLRRGILAYVKNHPADVRKVKHLPEDAAPRSRVRIR